MVVRLAEQLCPKEEAKIEVNPAELSEWFVETQMSDSLTPSNISNSPRNPSLHAAFCECLSIVRLSYIYRI